LLLNENTRDHVTMKMLEGHKAQGIERYMWY